jgi:hypothetical protein
MTGLEKLMDDCKREISIEFEMKYLGMMNYFLGLEVWQKDEQIFLGKGKYVVETLKYFGMQSCRPMATPMVTNWKNIDASNSKGVYPTLYRYPIGSLMY